MKSLIFLLVSSLGSPLDDINDFYFSNTSLEVMEGIRLELRIVLIFSLYESRINFGIPRTGGYRYPWEQNKLFFQRLSNHDGYADTSHHQHGTYGDALAFDIFGYTNGDVDYNHYTMRYLADVIMNTADNMNIELLWGGNWEQPDMPHFYWKRGVYE